MTAPEIDYAALFAATPSPYLVLGPDLVIVDVNRVYLEATGRTRKDLVGQYIFDAFPHNPADPDADGVRNLNASLHRVLTVRERDTMALQKYDIPAAERLEGFEERWWSPINTPVLGPDGTVAWIIHRVEDVTAFAHARQARRPLPGEDVSEREQAMEAELYARSRELQRLNEELRQAPCELLDRATDPPLDARPEHLPRPQASLSYTAGDALVLYTDGLIERRGPDIDTGLARLTDALRGYSQFSRLFTRRVGTAPVRFREQQGRAVPGGWSNRIPDPERPPTIGPVTAP